MYIGSNVTEEMHLSLCDTLTDPLLLSGSKTAADGVTLSEQEQNSQVVNLLGITNSPIAATDLEPGISNSPIVETDLEPGITNSPKVATDLEPSGFPETGQGIHVHFIIAS